MKPRKPIKRTAVKKINPERRKREFARTYHSKERVAFVKDLLCALCLFTPCDNAHVKSKSGMGRKGDYTTIAALCRRCHAAYDTGKLSREELGIVERDAGKVEAAWKASQ